MANVNQGLAKQNSNVPAPQVTVKNLLSNINYKKRFEELLGKKAAGFISSIINISNTLALKGCDAESIVKAAVMAASLDLPIDPNLGLAYIVPYNDKNRGKIAQFQLGYKSFIQLSMRSSQYKTISSSEVYEGEIKKYNRITGDIQFNEDFVIQADSKVVGYIAYFRLLNGFEKYLYMTVEQLQAHGKKYSQSYKSNKDWVRNSSLWTTNFNAMATKTVLKLLLSKFGILSIEMQKALEADQAIIKTDITEEKSEDGENKEEFEYPDNAQDVEYTELNTELNTDFSGTPFKEKEGEGNVD